MTQGFKHSNTYKFTKQEQQQKINGEEDMTKKKYPHISIWSTTGTKYIDIKLNFN